MSNSSFRYQQHVVSLLEIRRFLLFYWKCLAISFKFSLQQVSPFLLLLMVAIVPSLGKNIFLGSAQILLGYVGK
jgi:hypothetical protein